MYCAAKMKFDVTITRKYLAIEQNNKIDRINREKNSFRATDFSA